MVLGGKGTLRLVDFRVFQLGYGLEIGLRVVRCSLRRRLRRFEEAALGSQEMQ